MRLSQAKQEYKALLANLWKDTYTAVASTFNGGKSHCKAIADDAVIEFEGRFTFEEMYPDTVLDAPKNVLRVNIEVDKRQKYDHLSHDVFEQVGGRTLVGSIKDDGKFYDHDTGDVYIFSGNNLWLDNGYYTIHKIHFLTDEKEDKAD